MLLKPPHSLFRLNKTLTALSLPPPSYTITAFKKTSNHPTTHNKPKHLFINHHIIPTLLKTLRYSINTHKFPDSIIETLQEYIRGSDMLEKGNYPLAIRQFQIALQFLPKTTTDDNSQNYQTQYQTLLLKLLQSHIMTNKKVKSFTQSYKDYLSESTPLTELISTLIKIQQNDFQPLQTQQPPQKLWQELVRAFAFRQSKQCFGKHVPIEKIKETKDLTLKYIGLFLYEKIKARKNKERESIYLDTCRQLLKQTEQFEPSKIVKPLSLMACNLLAGDQYLQAEGLMSHCLSVLEQFYHQNPGYLKTDQEYIMCKLMLARVFEGVKRGEESRKIREEYEPLYDERQLLIQELVQVPYRQL